MSMAENVIEVPEPARSIIDFVCDEDRRYFEDHPQARFYDRALHPSELWPWTIPPKGVVVRVYQIVPGVRMRATYPEGGEPDKQTIGLIKHLRKTCKKGHVPLRDERLENLHVVGVC